MTQISVTLLVEEAVSSEFERLSERGGVLGVMETGYQRGKIQDESLYYEHKKHDGSLPIVGVNTFLKEDSQDLGPVELSRSTEEEKRSQLERLRDFQGRDPQKAREALERIKQAAIKNDNVFAELTHAVRTPCCGVSTDRRLVGAGTRVRNTSRDWNRLSVSCASSGNQARIWGSSRSVLMIAKSPRVRPSWSRK